MPRKKRKHSKAREVVAARLQPAVWRALRAEARKAEMPIGVLLERMIAMEVKRRRRRRTAIKVGGTNGGSED